MNLTLYELLRGYPGGIAALARATSRCKKSLYRVGHGVGATPPLQAVLAIAEAFRALGGELAGYDSERLLALWRDARRERLARVGRFAARDGAQ